jgi:uncharacterized protein YbaR (Trm112 family)
MPEEQSLLELLACPKCHGKLARIDSPDGFACAPCALFYAMDDGLPNMLIEDATPWPASSNDVPNTRPSTSKPDGGHA